MSAMLIADWCPLGNDTYFRKFEIYSMAWQNEINMENLSVAVGAYGGPVALIRDRKKFVKVQGIGKPIISIYSASGNNISSIIWSSGQIIQLGWSSTEDLLCVQDDGSVLIYDMFGTHQHTFSMGQEAQDTKVIEAKTFASVNGTGLAVLTTTSFRIFLVNNVKNQNWAVISEDRQTRVLVAKDRELYVLKQSEQHALPVVPDFSEPISSIVEMAVSQNNRHVALFASNGILWIGSADLKKRYCEFDTKCPSQPKQLVWCGTEAKRSHRADEYIRLVKNELDDAVKQCIEAAGYEFDTTNQKMLIRAAQFGKGFIPDLNPDSYVKMCRLLRVLNAVRDHKIGIPLTYTQLHHLTIQVLLDRLVLRRHYYLAIQIAKYLKLPYNEGSSRILAHWACYKVKQTQLDREQVARDIADKLGYAPGVSYSEIAMKAADCGRKQLAIKLMDYEPKASLQVPLLLRLGEDRPALVKAIESGDTDLVYTVLLHLRENMPLGEFQMAVRNYPVAQALYLKYCRDHNRETLRDIYVQEDDFNAQAAFFIQESYDPKNTMSKEASLSAAQESYKKGRNEFSASLCEEQLKLLRYQKTLEEKFHREFVGRSLHDTVYFLLLLHEVKLADKLRTEYRVTDRRYWWLRIQSLAELGDWIELEKFSKSKKSPIGMEPFVDVALKYESKYEAQKYLPKVRDELKVKYYVKAGLYEDAAKIAFEQKDLQALMFVQARSAPADRTLSEKICLLVSQLSSKK
ncbi:hypothetical protein L9F63_010714 [Diploptera punctata]|uniref:Vacuolar protein sorting-associated protein 16 homolog n=1 Tax=Diploptera punctata TaxID=6984 RepID=A0AAD8EPQ0_DIPPU|nr:hypothetical protein L9F63_010714 [Diploptera punctata]